MIKHVSCLVVLVAFAAGCAQDFDQFRTQAPALDMAGRDLGGGVLDGGILTLPDGAMVLADVGALGDMATGGEVPVGKPCVDVAQCGPSGLGGVCREGVCSVECIRGGGGLPSGEFVPGGGGHPGEFLRRHV